MEEKTGVIVCKESYRSFVTQKGRDDAKGRSIHKVVHLEMKGGFCRYRQRFDGIGLPLNGVHRNMALTGGTVPRSKQVSASILTKKV